MPVAAEHSEIANGRHYNGHPISKTIGHWITAYGTVPPASPVPGGPVHHRVRHGEQTFSYSTSSFASYFLQ